jgi:hypothetical protein
VNYAIQVKPAGKSLCRLSSAFYLAEKKGEGLGRREILFRALPPSASSSLIASQAACMFFTRHVLSEGSKLEYGE